MKQQAKQDNRTRLTARVDPALAQRLADATNAAYWDAIEVPSQNAVLTRAITLACEELEKMAQR